jgi:hypothetical protein
MQPQPLPEGLSESWRAVAAADKAVDRRERDADDREDALDSREERLDTRETATAGRGKREHLLLAEADTRDDEANARDAAANRRDMAASIDEFLENPIDTDTLRARAAAALDRADARSDRAASKADRSNLTDDEPSSPA